MHQAPTGEQLASLNVQFKHLVKEGEIRNCEPYSVEKRQDDHLDLARIAMSFDSHGYAELRTLIDVINTYL